MKPHIQRDPQSRAYFGTVDYEAGVDPALKPCPFCGEVTNLTVFGVPSNAHYFVRREVCGGESHGDDARLPALRFNKRSRAAVEAAHRTGFARGIAAWNRRAGAV